MLCARSNWLGKQFLVGLSDLAHRSLYQQSKDTIMLSRVRLSHQTLDELKYRKVADLHIECCSLEAVSFYEEAVCMHKAM